MAQLDGTATNQSSVATGESRGVLQQLIESPAPILLGALAGPAGLAVGLGASLFGLNRRRNRMQRESAELEQQQAAEQAQLLQFDAGGQDPVSLANSTRGDLLAEAQQLLEAGVPASQVQPYLTMAQQMEATERQQRQDEIAAGQRGAEAERNLRTFRATQTNAIRDDTARFLQPLYDSRLAINRALQMPDDPFGDEVIVNSFARMLNPKGVLTDADVARVEGSQAVVDTIMRAWEKAQAGTKLLPEERQMIFRSMARAYQQMAGQAQLQLDPYVASATAYGIPITEIYNPQLLTVPPEIEQYSQATIADNRPVSRGGDVTPLPTTTGPDGTVRVQYQDLVEAGLIDGN